MLENTKEWQTQIHITNLENLSCWGLKHKNKLTGQKRLRNAGSGRIFILRLDIQDCCQALLLNIF